MLYLLALSFIPSTSIIILVILYYYYRPFTFFINRSLSEFKYTSTTNFEGFLRLVLNIIIIILTIVIRVAIIIEIITTGRGAFYIVIIIVIIIAFRYRVIILFSIFGSLLSFLILLSSFRGSRPRKLSKISSRLNALTGNIF